MISILIITKGNNSINIGHRVTSLVLCTSSTHGLHFVPSFVKISSTVLELWSRLDL